MRLADFIEQNRESILRAWEGFAATIETRNPTLDSKGLRNHVEIILLTVIRDMRTSQTAQQQFDKSQGRAGIIVAEETAAATHGVTRLDAGFSLIQMVSEYRALRASVLRLWLSLPDLDTTYSVDDMVRFNEAIDQAIVESITSYESAVESTRKMVLGALGHDLRTPLGAVQMGAELLLKDKELSLRDRKISSQVLASVGRANQIVCDLLDLARINLSTGIPVQKRQVDLAAISEALVTELRACHPEASLHLTSPKELIGQFDPIRMGQVFSNLISNAIQHGDVQRQISLMLECNDKEAWFSVHNFGDPIPDTALSTLFSPNGRFSQYSTSEQGARRGLGLGLFIAAEIVSRHGGHMQVKSSQQDGTFFEFSVPRT